MNISTRVSGAKEVAADLTKTALESLGRAKAVENHYGAVLEAKVKARASGRPGPRVVTGEYLSTIDHHGGEVGSDHPAAHRLEAGFVGTDSLGHMVDQPPFPHFGPAVDEVADPFAEAAAAAVLR